MSRLARWGSAPALALSGLLLLAAPSYAGGGFQRCIDQAVNHNGEPPTCTKENGTWVASWPDGSGVDGSGGGGVPGAFVLLLVIGLLVGIGLTVWKVSTARRLATQSGMDPGLATQMTLLTDDGLDATYLAASLRPRPATAAPPPATAPVRDASTRLAELKGLLDRGVVTQAEYDARRQAIIDSV
jgi:hypothetical protein